MLLYCSDLIFQTKIASTAGALGGAVRVVRSVDRLREALTSAGAAMVIVDLDAEDAVEAVEAAASASPQPRVVAFVSHVHAELAQAARAAGANEVLARSAFVARLPSLVAPA
ncbi:MAG: hypothetical protein KDA22_03390 [Phycisphaerales bacterium]|nr:hypothetical protein [Phycisphaerales bacterium]